MSVALSWLAEQISVAKTERMSEIWEQGMKTLLSYFTVQS